MLPEYQQCQRCFFREECDKARMLAAAHGGTQLSICPIVSAIKREFGVTDGFLY